MIAGMLKSKYPLVSPPIERSWIERHPRWKIPLGAVLILLFGVVCSVPGLFIAQRTIQNSGAYVEALAMAEAEPEATNLLGDGWKPGVWTWGHFKSGPGLGYADLSIPVSGPKGSGAIEIVARKNGDRWFLRKVCLVVPAVHQTVDLMQTAPAQP
jgi:hypothetical protein